VLTPFHLIDSAVNPNAQHALTAYAPVLFRELAARLGSRTGLQAQLNTLESQGFLQRSTSSPVQWSLTAVGRTTLANDGYYPVFAYPFVSMLPLNQTTENEDLLAVALPRLYRSLWRLATSIDPALLQQYKGIIDPPSISNTPLSPATAQAQCAKRVDEVCDVLSPSNAPWANQLKRLSNEFLSECVAQPTATQFNEALYRNWFQCLHWVIELNESIVTIMFIRKMESSW
jgi:hypothetical protein